MLKMKKQNASAPFGAFFHACKAALQSSVLAFVALFLGTLAHADEQSVRSVVEAEGPGVGHSVGFLTRDGWAAKADVPNTYMVWNAIFKTPFEGRGNATFKMRIDINNTNLSDKIVNLDLFDRTANKVIASKLLTRGQFMQAGLNGGGVSFPLFFNTFGSNNMRPDGVPHELEARVWTYGKAYVEVDKIVFTFSSYAFRGVDTASDGLVSYANILRGANSNAGYSRGQTFPATALPFGFNMWSPVTRVDDPNSSTWFYGMDANADYDKTPLNKIYAFAAVHEPSPWIGNRQTLQIMPMLLPDGKLPQTWDPSQGNLYETDRVGRGQTFVRANQIARPHYYSVYFDNGLRTEYTPSNHAAHFRFTIPEGQSEAAILVDKFTDIGETQTDGVEQVVYGWTKDGAEQHNAPIMYFYAQFDTPFFAARKLGDVATVLRFKGDATKPTEVKMRIATSFISAAQAKANLLAEIPSGQTFDTTKANAAAAWNDKLGKIAIPGATEQQMVKLYSNMYRAFLYPNNAWESVNGKASYISPYAGKLDYSSPSMVTRNPVRSGKLYTNNGFWDTYRTTWPLYSLLMPAQTGEMIDGFLLGYKDGGWVTRWSDPGYIDCMVSTSSDVAFADAYLKGVRNFDIEAAYASMVRNAATASGDVRVGRKDNLHAVFYGYKPSNGEAVPDKDQTASYVAWSLESYINDAAIAQMAKTMGKNDEYVYYNNRALNYTKLFSKETSGQWAGGWFRGKDMGGAWVDNQQYIYYYDDGISKTPIIGGLLDEILGVRNGVKSQRTANPNPNTWGFGYTEGNAWHYALTVPHDATGLANLYGGRAALGTKLDAMFSTPMTIDRGSYANNTPELVVARDIGAMGFGQYNHSNQPSHGYIFMYNYAGQPWKAQYWVREVMNKLYGSGLTLEKDVPDGTGYFGDDDNGEQSAWYVFNAMGFYPLAVGRPEYVIGAPHHERTEVTLENGKKIVVLAPGVSDFNRYIQSVKLNGVGINRTYLMHSELANGALLQFTMGSTPSQWGTAETSIPPSLTSGNHLPAPEQSLLHSGDYQIIASSTGAGTDQIHGLVDRSSAESGTWTASGSSQTNGKPYVTLAASAGSTARLTHYTLTSAGTSSGGDPNSWTLYGSTDGNNWTVLDRRQNVKFKWRYYTQPFALANPVGIKYIKLEVDAPSSVRIAELELYGRPSVQPVNFMGQGMRLEQNQSITSPNGQYRLIMQGDGNLVIYNQKTNRSIWASNTVRGTMSQFEFQYDGNLVVYTMPGHTSTWTSNTNDTGPVRLKGVRLQMQDDGNLVLYNAANRVLWASGSCQSCG